jgi:hypothetical protein
MELHELPLGNGLHQTSYPEHPGLRLYTEFSASGFPMTSTNTQHAVTLWNPENYDSAPFDDPDSRRALELRLLWENKVRHFGPFEAHYKRAFSIAMAFLDGAYAAVHRLDKVFHLRSGPKDDAFNSLKRAIDLSQADYCLLRDVLYDDHDTPYLVACLVANRFTRHFTTTLHPRF